MADVSKRGSESQNDEERLLEEQEGDVVRTKYGPKVYANMDRAQETAARPRRPGITGDEDSTVQGEEMTEGQLRPPHLDPPKGHAARGSSGSGGPRSRPKGQSSATPADAPEPGRGAAH